MPCIEQLPRNGRWEVFFSPGVHCFICIAPPVYEWSTILKNHCCEHLRKVISWCPPKMQTHKLMLLRVGFLSHRDWLRVLLKYIMVFGSVSWSDIGYGVFSQPEVLVRSNYRTWIRAKVLTFWSMKQSSSGIEEYLSSPNIFQKVGLSFKEE